MTGDDAERPQEGAADRPPLNLVAIGASAGGIAALRSFFSEVPESPGIVFVVVMHLMPERESSLAEVLQTSCAMPVTQVHERVRMEPDHVYVIPPNRNLAVTDGHLEIQEFDRPRARRSPIDFFFRTVADTHPDGIGVLLSGAGSDGVVGLKEIKEKGGLILVQSPDDAEQDTMPRSAITTGLVDFVLPARELGKKVVELRSEGIPWTPPVRAEDLEDGEEERLRKVLSQLHARTGRDFSGYKRNTVLRRVSRRMQVTGTRSLEDYLDHLRGSGSEALELMRDLLISVTNFFRDPEAFQALEKDVIPELVHLDRDPGRQIRVWVPGCATGEEAYSLAMLLHERAATLQIRPSIQIFATDLDEQALALARDGLYPDAIAADVSQARLERFFTPEGAHLRVRQELRETVLFSRHDILQDPPFSRLDLVSCRNLLIYLGPELQDRVLGIVHYALRDEGWLFLGSSESIDERRHSFVPVDKASRTYRRKPNGSDRVRLLPDIPFRKDRVSRDARGIGVSSRAGRGDGERHRTALETHAPPSILVDSDLTVLHVSETANRYLDFPSGRPTADLLKVIRPGLALPLRALLEQVRETGEPGHSSWIGTELDGEPRRIQLWASPTEAEQGDPEASPVLVLLLESSPGAEEGKDPDRERAPGAEMDDLEAELGLTRDRLHRMIERSEVRQEELQASNEELQSINEEYKSTLEELETSKEELQSMNEELKTVNDELKEKVEALARANNDLRNLIASTEIATLFLDRELRVKRFTPALAELFNVMPVDEGRPVSHITHGLDYPRLADDCEEVLDSLRPVEREVVDAGGDDRSYLARITPYRTEDDGIGGVVATFTDITRVRVAQKEVRQSGERFQALVEATAEVVWTTDPEGAIKEDSPSWRAFTGQETDEWLDPGGRLEAVHPEDRERAAREWKQAVSKGAPMVSEYRLWHAATEEWRFTTARAVPIRDSTGEVREWVGMNSDVTEQKLAENALRIAKAKAEEGNRAKSQFLSTLSHELRTPLNAVIGLSDLLLEEVGGPLRDSQREYMERIKRSAWHQLSMIEEILGFSRSEAGMQRVEVGEIDLVEIAESVTDMMAIEAEAEGLELRLEAPDEPLTFRSDPGKVRQIVTNLVGNAIRYTPDGRVVVELRGDDDAVEVTVADTGPGIPADQTEAIFDPFVQVRDGPYAPVGGTGLGLTVSRRLARTLGGDVEVESTPGEGSRFTLRLPRDVRGDGEGGGETE